jgi:hypothetical protein
VRLGGIFGSSPLPYDTNYYSDENNDDRTERDNHHKRLP